MPKKHTIIAGKILRRLARLRGGGSALPGLLIERFEPDFLASALQQLLQGVVLISGTNGKTTTTKMVSELLASQGLRVFTNRSGSNFTRGVVSALLEVIEPSGNLPFDIAVLELDEAHAMSFIKQVKPRYSLLLNVMRDQLDRFGEIDHTAKLLARIAESTTDGLVLNHDDPLIKTLAAHAQKTAQVAYFGAEPALQKLFPSDAQLQAAAQRLQPKHDKLPSAAVSLASFTGQKVTFILDGQPHAANLSISGFYNYLNAAAALALVKLVVPAATTKTLLGTLEHIEPAFGRGERIIYKQQPIEFVLVKNPAGFRLAIASATAGKTTEATMIAINDQFADGRDMSWLWDVDLGAYQQHGVQLVSGVRAYDMALRLQYDNVPITSVEPDLTAAFQELLAKYPDTPKRIYCTYTAMLGLRKLATKRLGMDRAL